MNSHQQSPKVLQLITGLGVGGAERVVMELTDGLASRGWAPRVVALNADAAILAQYPNPVFPIHLLRIKKRNFASVMRGLIELVRIVKHEKIEIVHAHMFHALIAALACRMATPGLKLVFTSHNFAGFSGLREWIIRLSKPFRQADIVFMRGQHARMNARYTQVIPNGVKLAVNAPGSRERVTNPGRFVFLFIGRFEPQKNPLALIDAFARMRNRNAELWMAGDGSLRSDIEARTSVAGLSDRVRLLGVRTDVSTLLQQADCFVMSSAWEGLPMALLEAGAAALPVVATPVGAIPAVLADDAGFLATYDRLTDALNAVIDDFPSAQQRGLRLRSKIQERYSLAAFTNSHAILYQQEIRK